MDLFSYQEPKQPRNQQRQTNQSTQRKWKTYSFYDASHRIDIMPEPSSVSIRIYNKIGQRDINGQKRNVFVGQQGETDAVTSKLTLMEAQIFLKLLELYTTQGVEAARNYLKFVAQNLGNVNPYEKADFFSIGLPHQVTFLSLGVSNYGVNISVIKDKKRWSFNFNFSNALSAIPVLKVMLQEAVQMTWE